MSQLTDSLTNSLTTLLASGQEIPASKVRQWGGQLIAAIGTLEARARGNTIHYTSGVPGNALGQEGDLGVNKLTGDYYQFTGGQFVFLFNGLGRAGVFTPIPANQFGTHPAFANQDQVNAWLLAHAGTGGGPGPAAPTIASFTPASAAVDDNVTLTGTNFGAAPGTAGTVKFNGILANVVSWSPTSIVAKVPTGGATGPLTVTTSGGTATSSSNFTVTTTPQPANELTPATADYWNNSGIARTNSAGRTIPAALSMLKVNLNGTTSVVITAFNTGSGGIVYSDGQTTNGFVASSATPSDTTLSNLSGGTLTLIFGAEQRSYEQGDVLGHGITKIKFPAGQQGNFLAPQQADTAIVVIGDSITNGVGASSQQLTGWTALLRQSAQTTYVTGYGSAQLLVAGAAGNLAALQAQMSAALVGATHKLIIVALGTNDKNGGDSTGNGSGTLAAVTAAYTNLLNLRDQSFTNVPLLTVLPIYRQNEAVANPQGWTLPDLRTALAQAAAGRANVVVLDGSQVLADATHLPDGIHPDNAGHQSLADAISQQAVSLLNGISWVTPPHNNGAISGTTIYQNGLTGGRFGGGFNSQKAFMYPTGDQVVLVEALNQTVNRTPTNPDAYNATLLGLTSVEQLGDYNTYEAVFYLDKNLTRSFKGGTELHSEPLPGGNPSFVIRCDKDAITLLLNGVPYGPTLPPLPGVKLWVGATLANTGDVNGSGSHLTGVTLTAPTLIDSGL